MMQARSSQIVQTLVAMALLLAASLACGHGDAQTATATTTTQRDREHEMISLCEDMKDPFSNEYWCLRLARSYAKGDAEAHVARDLPRAVALYDHFCDVRHDGPACLLAGTYRARGQTEGDADAWFAKACRAGVSDAKSEPTAATELHRLGCTRREADSCIAHAGDLLAEGRRMDAVKAYGDVCFLDKRVDACVAAANVDPAEISTYLRSACDLGDAASCTKLHAKESAPFDEAKRRFAEAEKENERQQHEQRRPSAPPVDTSDDDSSTTVSMQNVNVNGLSATNLTCTGLRGGMLAPLTLTAALGERAAALRACGVHGTIHVTWTASGNAVDSVTSSPANACVVSAMRASKLTMAKRCAADLALWV